MEAVFMQKFRNLITTCPRLGSNWREISSDNSHEEVWNLRRLTLDFLKLVSGEDVVSLLSDVLNPLEQQSLPMIMAHVDTKGERRLHKLNNVVAKANPLKPWSLRSNADQTARMAIELTARRCLCFLSGNEIVPLLQDILYPSEKEIFAQKHKFAIMRVGESLSLMHPRDKAVILNALRQAGFDREELLQLRFSFNRQLWNNAHVAAANASTKNNLDKLERIRSRMPALSTHSLRQDVFVEEDEGDNDFVKDENDDDEVWTMKETTMTRSTTTTRIKLSSQMETRKGRRRSCSIEDGRRRRQGRKREPSASSISSWASLDSEIFVDKQNPI